MADNNKTTSYSGYTPAWKIANEKYSAKYHEIKVRMDPEWYEMAKPCPESSRKRFILYQTGN